jgi:hypothetical protein
VASHAGKLATVSVEVPPLTRVSRVVLPLLGRAAHEVEVTATTESVSRAVVTIGDGESLPPVATSKSIVAQRGKAADGAEQLLVDLPLPGRYSFVIAEK